MPTIATPFHARVAAAALAVMLCACSTPKPVLPPSPPPAPTPAPLQPSAPPAPDMAPETMDNGARAIRAQTHLDAREYPEAIILARAILQSEPGNMLANRIIALGGLGVTIDAVGELGRKNVSAEIKSEAGKLTKLLRNVEPAPTAPPGAPCNRLERLLNKCQ